jgi:hypothetical protein
LYAAFFETSILNGGVKNYVLVAKDALDHLVGAMTAPDAAQEFARRSNVRSAVAVNATRAGIQRQLPVFRAAVALTQRENNHTGWIFNDAASAHLMDGIENAYARKMKGRRFNRAERDMPLIPGAYVPAVLRPAA